MNHAPYAIDWSSSARRSLNRVPEKVGVAVLEFVYGPLADNPPRVGKPLRLELGGLHGARRGDYRIVYEIDAEARRVETFSVEHRSHVYRSRGSQ